MGGRDEAVDEGRWADDGADDDEKRRRRFRDGVIARFVKLYEGTSRDEFPTSTLEVIDELVSSATIKLTHYSTKPDKPDIHFFPNAADKEAYIRSEAAVVRYYASAIARLSDARVNSVIGTVGLGGLQEYMKKKSVQ